MTVCTLMDGNSSARSSPSLLGLSDLAVGVQHLFGYLFGILANFRLVCDCGIA